MSGDTGGQAHPGTSSRLRTVLPLLIDVAVPMGAYYALHALGASDFAALTTGGAVSGLLALAGIARNRRIDGFAVFVLVLFALGMLTTVLTGDVRFLLAKDSFGTGIGGLLILASTALHRPLTFYTGRRFTCGGDRERERWWERTYEQQPGFRRVLRHLAVLWGVGLLVEAAVRVVLAYALPPPTVVALSTVLQIVFFGGLIGLSSWYGRRARKTVARLGQGAS